MSKTFNTNNNNKNFLKRIRSKYILEQILNNLQTNILLNIIRYNKNIRNKLNKDINDYKKEYSKIELEIIPCTNERGKFINITKKNEANYHIYFNDNKEEIKVNKNEINGKINKIKIIIDYKIKSLFHLFKNCKIIKELNFIKFNKDDIKNTSHLFENCTSLESINISKINLQSVIDMSYMFYGCSSLKN